MDFKYKCPYCDGDLKGTTEFPRVDMKEGWCDHCDSKFVLKVFFDLRIKTIKLDESER